VTKRRILFVAEAVTLAHVGRMFALANLIDREKYTPVLAWHPRYNRLLGELTDEFYPVHSITTEEFVDKLRTAKPVYDLRTMEVYVAWELEVFREARPDAVIGDFRLSLATSAKISGIPYVNVVNAHWSPFARPRFIVPDCPPSRIFGPAMAQLVFNVARPFFFLGYANDFNRLAQKFGRLSFGYDLRKIYCEGDRTLYPDLPEITPTYDLPPSHRYLGPVAWAPKLDQPDFLTQMPDDRPIVYVNLGTSGDETLLPRILDVLDRMPVRVIAATGGKLRLQSPSPDIHLVDFIDGDAACRRADLIVFNGGVGGTHQAVMAGKPVVGIPSNLDQFLNMHFVEKAGFGRIVRGDAASEKSIARKIGDVLGKEVYRDRARELGERTRSYDPGAILNEVLDELFEGRPAKHWPTPHRGIRSDIASVASHPPIELVEQVVRAGILAPSATNCQPWRYSWNGEVLEVYLVPDRAFPFLHFVNPDVAVSLGAVLTNMRVAAAARQHRLEVELFPKQARDGLMARVWFVEDSTSDASLADTLEARCTNRHGYEDRPIPDAIRDELLTVANSERPVVQTQWIDDPVHRDHVADSMAVFYRILFENPTLHLAFMEWMRWTPEAERSAGTGLGLASLELGGVPRRLFRLASFSSLARMLKTIGFFRLYPKVTSRHLRQSAAIGLITTSDNDGDQLVLAGEVFEAMWLLATRHGLAFHPIGGLPSLALRCRFGAGAGLSASERRASEQAIAAVTEVAPAFSERMPAIMFRIGYAPPPSARSVRLPIEEIFEVREGTASPTAVAAAPSHSA
jgi:UDP:flavonoid glycosyltransferase YjiC (YdhE family)/nitroreductase